MSATLRPVAESERIELFVLVSESFYPLYSFLFGLGFAVRLASARAKGSGSSLLYFRRLLVLFLIGTLHTVLIWDGDIRCRIRSSDSR
jgi:uncharacterized protein